KPPKKEAPPPPVDEKADFLARLAEKRRRALERVEEARQEVHAERKTADEAAAALRARLSKRPFMLALKGGEKLEGAIARSFTMQEARIETGGRALTVAWDSVEPASLRPAADALFDASSAEDQFERGRFFVARRMWKEAIEAFERAA